MFADNNDNREVSATATLPCYVSGVCNVAILSSAVGMVLQQLFQEKQEN